MEEISVVSLAERVGLTPYYFSTVFHERMGQTFSAYVTNVRIEHAKQILFTHPEILVCEAAHTHEADYISKLKKAANSAIKLLRTMGLCDIIKMLWLALCRICKSGGKRYGKYSHGNELPHNTPVSSGHASGCNKGVQDIFERRNPLKSKGFRMGEDKYEIRYRRSAKCWKIHAVQRHHQRRNSGG